MTTIFSLKNQVALVTGAASGIGYAIASCLSAAGAQVAMIDRAEDITTLASKMENSARGYVFDLANVDALGALIEQIHRDFGRIDILVNNAGIGMLEPVGEVQLSSWNTTMLINMTAPFFLAQHCARHMKAQGFGRLINIASQASVIALNEHAAYCTSKSGMVSFTRVLAAELGPFGITANAISPTVVETELGKRYWHGERAEQMKSKIPSRRFATPDEIASSVLYLSSKEAAMVNGENLVIDGGYSMI
jgi:2-deoxy-D-gluconate 3-dehydrogenase